MTSRERILAAVNREPVDRVPIDFNGTRQSGISVFAYAPLRTHLARTDRAIADSVRAQPRIRIFDLYQMLAEVEPALASRFGADCVALNRRAVAFGLVN